VRYFAVLGLFFSVMAQAGVQDIELNTIALDSRIRDFSAHLNCGSSQCLPYVRIQPLRGSSITVVLRQTNDGSYSTEQTRYAMLALENFTRVLALLKLDQSVILPTDIELDMGISRRGQQWATSETPVCGKPIVFVRMYEGAFSRQASDLRDLVDGETSLSQNTINERWDAISEYQDRWQVEWRQVACK
jgi:hypothetical protein